VRVHSAVLNETPSVWAMAGMRGAPRLDTMAIIEPTSTRLGTKSRPRHESDVTDTGSSPPLCLTVLFTDVALTRDPA
jgi:hypothetical protein